MKIKTIHAASFVLSALSAALMLSTAAFAESGRFNFVNGEVRVTRADGSSVAAAVGMEVNPGDQVITGVNGVAQLTMVDEARLALRANSNIKIESYATRRDGRDNAVVSLFKGTLRAFTGLVASRDKDKFVMKTRVATVGIRGSGNILHVATKEDCDEELRKATGGDCDVTVNHTIEGSHIVTGQGGSIVTGPGQTVLATASNVSTIQTPQIIKNLGVQLAAKSQTQSQGGQSGDGGVSGRTFSEGGDGGQGGQPLIGNNGAFVNTNPSGGTTQAAFPTDPQRLQDIALAGGFTISGQSRQLNTEGAQNGLRGYVGYDSTLTPTITGGTITDVQTLDIGGTRVVIGRIEGGVLGLTGASSAAGFPGSVHFAYAPSGFPTYMSDVLTGTATYNLVSGTSPTNQDNNRGALGTARLDVNFSNRTLNSLINVSMPAVGSNGGGSWTITGTAIPIVLNRFYASTGDRLVIVNGQGISSTNNAFLSGSIDGSFVGTALNGAIVAYFINDETQRFLNRVSGVAAFQSGTTFVPNVAYRYGLAGQGLIVNATSRVEDITIDANNRLTRFVLPGVTTPETYSIGTANAVDVGFDAGTGLTWGRWTGGSINAGGRSVNLGNQSMHYIFSGSQSAPVALPLTGTASYDVIGSTAPTDAAGNTGRLGTATLDANFSNRTVNTSVNIAINNQNWTGTANNIPIYRDQYFFASTGGSAAGLPNPALLVLSCAPNCGGNATGNLSGFFTGTSGQGAGLMYNFAGINGAIAFRRRVP